MSIYDIANRLVRWNDSVYNVTTRLENWEDAWTDSLTVVDLDQAYINAGYAFMASIASTGAAGTKKYVLDTDSTKYTHFRPAQIMLAEGTLEFSLYEDTSSTGGAGWGTVTPYNRNRTVTTTAASALYDSATSTGGTLIERWAIYGGTGPAVSQSGAETGRELEVILKRGTQYRIELDTTEEFYANLFWYEEGA